MSGIVHAVRRSDLRVSLMLVLINAVAVMLCTREIWFIVLFAVTFVWLCFRGQSGKGLKLATGYAVLFVLGRLTLGVRGFETIWLFSNLIRHMLIPIAYTLGLTDAPTGTLLTVFHKLRMPKSFGISTVVLLRFFPTIACELHAIRSSLKFRGTGVGFWNTLTHIPANFEQTMVPLLIRTTRISEELSAAAMVRGVRLNNKITSYEEVRFCSRDAVVLLVFSLLAMAVFAADKLSLLEVAL